MTRDAHAFDLVLDQPLGRFLQVFLYLANTDAPGSSAQKAPLNAKLGKEMRLARCAAPKCPLVPGRLEKGQEYPRRLQAYFRQ